MKALVTGATGVVGANLVRELLDADWSVATLLRPGPPRRALAGLPVERVAGDVLDPASLEVAMSGREVVFHAAAYFTYGGVDTARMESVAVDGTRNVVRAAAAAGVERVVLTSSSVVFGSSPDPTPRTEASTFTPGDASAYAVSKLRQLRVALDIARREGLPLVAACPTLTMGSWDYRLAQSHATLVRYLKDPWRTTFPGGGNVVAARDVARGHRLLAEHGDPGTSYLLASENLSWQELHTMVSRLCETYGPLTTSRHTAAYLTAVWSEATARLLGSDPTLTRDEVRMMGRWYWYDDARVRALGYAPRPAEEAVREALTWLHRAGHLDEALLTEAPATGGTR